MTQRFALLALFFGSALFAGGCGGSGSSGGAPSSSGGGSTAANVAPPVVADLTGFGEGPAPKSAYSTDTPAAQPAGTGSLRVLVHDAPTPQVDKVLVTIDEVSAHSEEAGWQIVSSATQEIDLLALQGGVVSELGLQNLPAGSYTQIRLHVLTASVVLPGGASEPLTIPSGTTSGLKIVTAFNLVEGGEVTLTLDWEIGAHLTHNKGQGWKLRPTIKVESVVSQNPCADIQFADPNLEAVVRAAINKPSGVISSADVQALTSLNARGQGIVSLEGVECLTSLTNFDLSANQVSDLSPLANLSSLRLFSAPSNQISNLSPLSGLTGLTFLSLSRNLIADATPVAGLTNLSFLALGHNQLSSIEPIRNLTRLETLGFEANQVSDISALAGLTSLKLLACHVNQIADISVLANTTQLEQLIAGSNQFSSVAPLANLNSLTSVAVNGNQITDLTPLGTLTNLVYLSVSANPSAQGHSALANLVSLRTLGADDCGFSDATLVHLSGLTSLTALAVSKNGLTTLAPLAGLVNLTSFSARVNSISDLSPLANATGMDNLSVGDNQISDLSPLTGLTSMRYLTIDRNQILDASPIQSLSGSLQIVNLLFNPIDCAASPTVQLLIGAGVIVHC